MAAPCAALEDLEHLMGRNPPDGLLFEPRLPTGVELARAADLDADLPDAA
jgi:hypothetical protein